MDSSQQSFSDVAVSGRRLFSRFVLFLFVIFLVGASFFVGRSYGQGSFSSLPVDDVTLQEAVILNKDASDVSVDFKLFWDAWDMLKEKYVDQDSLRANELLYGAIDGMLSATGDPYTTFFDPEDLADFSTDISGTFEGIGAEIGLRDGVLTAIAPLEGSPAQTAGMRAGDKILEIDGEVTSDMSINDAVKRLRGNRGSEVRLTIFREGDSSTQEILIVRDVIRVDSVTFDLRDDGIAYVQVSRFGDDTTTDFRRLFSRVRHGQVKGVVLDLRNNPGGYLDQAVSLASLMLPEGTPVVLEEDRNGKRTTIPSNGDSSLISLLDTPIVVLINKGSASASEILAGALRENRDDVILVGETSFGKGSVQELVPLSKSTAVKITIARWLTPKGRQINDEGIAPDESVELTNEDFDAQNDPQFDRAIDIVREKMGV
ncbi:MAG: S41 family peptidase [Candidatus Moranbacteria bacterium]|nr:S41 family peptidase [Candidatus Moranbacteria bacterium]